MNYLKVKYTSIYGEDEATELIKRVTRCLNEMMENYKKNEKHVNTGEGESFCNPASQNNLDFMDDCVDEEMDQYFVQIEKEKQVAFSGELERYLEEYPEKFIIEFDILSWWKVNSLRFPVLSMVAKDDLAIQASSVASESAFSTGGRTLDKFRSSLTPITVEILICCQDWLRSSKLPISVEELVKDLDKFELGIFFTFNFLAFLILFFASLLMCQK